MKIQKGIVKYKDRDDIVCTYGITDSGVYYYFIESEGSKRLSNGNIIVSTELVEAIDPMFKAKHIGVIDGAGKTVIPFNHRLIRSISDDLLLVEAAEAITDSVKEANQMKNDKTQAAKLVSTSALIKDKMNAKMGAEGRFLFNDQFSDATICDINGNNVVNNEYYSFVGIANGKLYLSKNTPDFEIVEHSILPEEVQNSVVPAEDAKPIDVSKVEVSQDVVEKTLTKSMDEVASEKAEEEIETTKEIVIPTVGSAKETEEAPVVPSDVVAPSEAMASTAPVAEEQVIVPSEEAKEEAPVTEEQVIVPSEEVKEEAPVTDEQVIVPNEEAKEEAPVTEEQVIFPSEEVKEEAPITEEQAIVPNVEAPEAPVTDEQVIVPNVEVPTTEEQVIVPSEEAVADPIIPDTEVEEAKDDATGGFILGGTDEEFVSFNDDLIKSGQHIDFEETPDNVIDEADGGEVDLDESVEDSSLDDLFHSTMATEEEEEQEAGRFSDSIIQTDSIEASNDFASYEEDHFDDATYETTDDTIMSDVAKSMQALMKQNKELKASLSATEEKLNKVLTSRRNLADKNAMQEKKIDALSTKIRSLDASLSKSEARCQSLDSKNREQEKKIQAQAHELEVMRPQLQGKEDLVQLLADAQLLLGDDESYTYSRDDYSRKAA